MGPCQAEDGGLTCDGPATAIPHLPPFLGWSGLHAVVLELSTVTAPPWPWCLAKLTCPFQSWRLCSARHVVWE